jgi:hypothetical protein
MKKITKKFLSPFFLILKKTPEIFTDADDIQKSCEIVEFISRSKDYYFYKAKYILRENHLGAEVIIRTIEKRDLHEIINISEKYEYLNEDAPAMFI